MKCVINMDIHSPRCEPRSLKATTQVLTSSKMEKNHSVVAKSHPCVRVQQQIFQEMQESMTTFVRGERILKQTIDQFVLNFFKSQANG